MRNLGSISYDHLQHYCCPLYRFFRHNLGYQYIKNCSENIRTVHLYSVTRSLFLAGRSSAKPVSSSTSIKDYKMFLDKLPTIFGIITFLLNFSSKKIYFTFLFSTVSAFYRMTARRTQDQLSETARQCKLNNRLQD